MSGLQKFVPAADALHAGLSKKLREHHAEIVASLEDVGKRLDELSASRVALRSALAEQFDPENLEKLQKSSRHQYVLLQQELTARNQADSWLNEYSRELHSLYAGASAKVTSAKDSVKSKLISMGFEERLITPELVNSHPDVLAAKAPYEAMEMQMHTLVNPQIPASPFAMNNARRNEIAAALQDAVKQSERMMAVL